MKRLQAGDKVVRQITRDGAVELNKATGEATSISTKTADTPRASPGTSGNTAAENVQRNGGEKLYTIGGVVDRVQSERTAKKRRVRKSNAKIYSRYTKPPGKTPKEKSQPIQRVSSKPDGKLEARLSFREGDKPSNGKLQHTLQRPGREAALLIHREVGKSDNTGVQAAHSTGKAAGGAARKLSAGYRRLKFRHQRTVQKARGKALKPNPKAPHQQSIRLRPNAKKAGATKKALHKRRMKKHYAKAYRAGKAGAKGTAVVAKKAAAVKAFIVKAALAVKVAALKAAKLAAVLKIVIPIAAVLFLLILLMAGISSCFAMFGGGVGSIVATTYTAEDEDILGAHADYVALENALYDRLANIHYEFPGYDEYRFFLDSIGHDPHELVSFLTAIYFAFTQEEVQATLQSLFNQQYVLTLTPIVEAREREEERTGTGTGTGINPEGYPYYYTYYYTYTVTVEYDWYVLVVSLSNRGIKAVAEEILTPDQLEIFHVLLEAQGNRPDLFGGEPLSIDELMERANIELPRILRPADNGTANQAKTQTQPPQDTDGTDIPPSFLPDSRFAAMMDIAEQFIGFPYVWGGSNPATSFDCSGFVSWVVNQSGAGSVGRTTANGLYNLTVTIAYYEARPGDLVFFQGTWNTRGASHVGIYVGGGRMIHAGNPIGFTSIRTAYWERHFKAFGRLP